MIVSARCSVREHDLIGTWVTLQPTPARQDDVTMEFRLNGELIYTIHERTKDQVIRLRWRLEGDVIVTDQPSAPREERTAFVLTPEGRLDLTYAGNVAEFVRRTER